MAIKTVQADLVGVWPGLVFGKAMESKPETGKSMDAFEDEHWMERLHRDNKGNLFIPPNAIKNMLVGAAKYLDESVPGKGKKKYWKYVEAGIMVIEPVLLDRKIEDVKKLRLFVPSDGRKGGGRRVWRNFPLLSEWSGRTVIQLLDPLLVDKPEIIERYLVQAGKFIGLLTFRPANGGYYGRFEVLKFKVIS